ncbi:MAG: permease-like cell division protein FtsX [Prevotella sp.]|nr:permease-like cell division protein FtsX [Prevotella sp.]
MKRRRKVTSRHHGMQVVTLCISTTMVLILLGLVVLSVLTARNLSTSVKENMAINLVLGDTVSLDEGQQLLKELQSQRYAKKVKYISQEEALNTMTEKLGANPVEFAGVNPFQAEIELQLKADYANTDSLRHISDVLMKDKRVVEVAYPADMIDDVNVNMQRISLILLALAVLLIIVSYSLISSSVRLDVYARRFTIHTQKLVGARWSLIRRPMLRRSILIGLVASLLACAVLAGIVYSLYRYQPGVDELITQREMVITAVSVFVFGFVIMLLCTLLSVNKFLRMTAGELYKI